MENLKRSQGNNFSDVEVIWELILPGLLIQETTTLKLKYFMEKKEFKKDTVIEKDLQRVYNYPVFPPGIPKIIQIKDS